jgi:hypothetical protein
MTRAIWVEKAWCPKIRSLVETFNKYAGKKALSLCAESLEKLVYYLDNDNGQVGIDAADALASIRQLNPHLITNFTGQKIDEKLSLYGNKTQFEQHGMPNSQTNMFASSDPYSSADTYASTDSYSSADPYASSSNSAQGTSSDANETEPSYQDYYQSEQSSNTQNENENDNQSKEEEKQSGMDELLSMSIEQLKIKNVTKIYIDVEEKKKRKCAMGDGEFEGYDGDLYQCTCGTLYHDSCLKIQAIYVGTCQICDREFLKKED